MSPDPNGWANRIIGDLRGAPADRTTVTVIDHYEAESELLPAGLLGPVTITAPGGQ